MPDFVELWREQEAFSEATFPGITPLAVARHLRSEADELIASPTDRLEWVDALLLSIDGARRAGMTCDELLALAFRKIEINRQRQWPAVVDVNESVEHIRNPEDTYAEDMQ
jgi:hypothetical protein